MIVQREAVFEALFQQLSTANNFLTKERGFRHWDDVEPGECPALFLVEGDEEWPERDWHRPAILSWEAAAVIYLCGSGGVGPDLQLASQLNSYIDTVQSALGPIVPFRQQQTLGVDGVAMTRIEGKIVKNPGYQTGKAIAVIPIRIHVAERY